MNTGFLGPAVATVLTVYGIETKPIKAGGNWLKGLQQYLPFTVLKHYKLHLPKCYYAVATVLTVYGIETETIMRLIV